MKPTSLYIDSATVGGSAVTIAGFLTTDLSGYRLVAYDAVSGAPIETRKLSGSLAIDARGSRLLSVSFRGLVLDPETSVGLFDPNGTLLDHTRAHEPGERDSTPSVERVDTDWFRAGAPTVPPTIQPVTTPPEAPRAPRSSTPPGDSA